MERVAKKLPRGLLSSAAKDYLKARGISKHHALLAGLHSPKLFGQQISSDLQIPYLDVHGCPTAFFRIRRLGRSAGPKFVQPKDTRPHLYFAPCIKWGDITSNPGVELFFTEGELKALKACLTGIPTLGIGGVDCWRYRGGVLPEFDAINWAGRNVTIVFDADAETNPHVLRAEQGLAQELNWRGANVFRLRLPQEE